MHIGTVWAAAYLTWGRGITPTWRRYRFAVAATAVWAVLVSCFNLVAGTNYGFLNRKPGATTILDLLGPWPWYVLAEIAIITAIWALVTWPWVRLAALLLRPRPCPGTCFADGPQRLRSWAASTSRRLPACTSRTSCSASGWSARTNAAGRPGERLDLGGALVVGPSGDQVASTARAGT